MKPKDYTKEEKIVIDVAQAGGFFLGQKDNVPNSLVFWDGYTKKEFHLPTDDFRKACDTIIQRVYDRAYHEGTVSVQKAVKKVLGIE